MNSDDMKGAWRQFRGKMKEQWGNLTDDELDKVDGKWDQLSGLIQSRYGRKREEVEADIERFREAHEQKSGMSAKKM